MSVPLTTRNFCIHRGKSILNKDKCLGSFQTKYSIVRKLSVLKTCYDIEQTLNIALSKDW